MRSCGRVRWTATCRHLSCRRPFHRLPLAADARVGGGCCCRLPPHPFRRHRRGSAMRGGWAWTGSHPRSTRAWPPVAANPPSAVTVAAAGAAGAAHQRHGCHYWRHGGVARAGGGCGPRQEPWHARYRRHWPRRCHRSALATSPAGWHAHATATRPRAGLHRRRNWPGPLAKPLRCCCLQACCRRGAGQAPVCVPRKLPLLRKQPQLPAWLPTRTCGRPLGPHGQPWTALAAQHW